MKTCPNCKASVGPQIPSCPMCGFSWQQPVAMQALAPHETRCVACSSIVTKGMRCIRCGVMSRSEGGISRSTLFGIGLAIVIIVLGMLIYNP